MTPDAGPPVNRINPVPSTLPFRPDTPMGRALAGRAIRLAEALEVSSGPAPIPQRPALAPEHVREAAKDALARGETHYTSRPGVVDLRKAIARISTEQGFPATAESVVVTNGGAEALYITLQAVIGKGDRVAAPEPLQPNVAEMIGFIGGDLHRISTSPDNRFIADIDDIFTADPAVILLSSPSPITGVALGDATLRQIVSRAADRGAVGHPRPLARPRPLRPDRARPSPPRNSAPASSTIGSFSSGYGLDGWRVGYFTAPPDRMKEMRELKQAMSICTTAVSQYAALAALDGPTDLARRAPLHLRHHPRPRHRHPHRRRPPRHHPGRLPLAPRRRPRRRSFSVPEGLRRFSPRFQPGVSGSGRLPPGAPPAGFRRLDLSSPTLDSDLAALTGERRP